MNTQEVIAAARASIEAHYHDMGFEPTSEISTKLWHLVVSLIEFCDAEKIDFDAVLGDVRQYFVETQPVGGSSSGRRA